MGTCGCSAQNAPAPPRKPFSCPRILHSGSSSCLAQSAGLNAAAIQSCRARPATSIAPLPAEGAGGPRETMSPMRQRGPAPRAPQIPQDSEGATPPLNNARRGLLPRCANFHPTRSERPPRPCAGVPRSAEKTQIGKKSKHNTRVPLPVRRKHKTRPGGKKRGPVKLWQLTGASCPASAAAWVRPDYQRPPVRSSHRPYFRLRPRLGVGPSARRCASDWLEDSNSQRCGANELVDHGASWNKTRTFQRARPRRANLRTDAKTCAPTSSRPVFRKSISTASGCVRGGRGLRRGYPAASPGTPKFCPTTTVRPRALRLFCLSYESTSGARSRVAAGWKRRGRQRSSHAKRQEVVGPVRSQKVHRCRTVPSLLPASPRRADFATPARTRMGQPRKDGPSRGHRPPAWIGLNAVDLDLRPRRKRRKDQPDAPVPQLRADPASLYWPSNVLGRPDRHSSIARHCVGPDLRAETPGFQATGRRP